MDTTISMSAVAFEADRLRRVRQHVNDTMPPGSRRDELHSKLNADAQALSSRKLIKG